MLARLMFVIGFLCTAFSVSLSTLAAQNGWPQFRGPSGQGVSEADKLPDSWGEGENIDWKVPIHGRGWSSPVAESGQIWLTTATEDGRMLSAICVEAKSGDVIYDKVLFEVDEPQFAHKFNSYASPSPVLDRERVFITFGSEGTACLDAKKNG